MPIYKCKMCGGSLDINNNESIVTCKYCLTSQTLPKLDNDEKLSLFDRASHFRRNNEFDNAMSIYEHMLQLDNSDSEIYWSIVLCRYGIEYVKDPISNKRIPTINRTQYKSILLDEDYLKALSLANNAQKEIYINEANTINEIQKGILELSNKEEPFDIFICYKETDNDGRRTEDSVIAQNIYKELTNEGYKVFFSRITLEDKIGSAYEPYIFAALNSSKVMLVIGTKIEYFNAVWVKNEWSRYLSLIAKGEHKTLVPCYKNMDPYDLPKEFVYLQAQDLNKLGYIQDLTRGIEKIIGKANKIDTITINNNSIDNTNTNNITSLVKRMYFLIENSDFETASRLSENILNLDYKNEDGYIGKLLCKFKVKKINDLKNINTKIENDSDYLNIIKFSKNKQKKNEFIAINDYINKSILYNDALSIYQKEFWQEAKELFELILNFKDANELINICNEKIEEERIKNEKAEQERLIIKEANRKKRNIILLVCLVAFLVFVFTKYVINPSIDYSKAKSLYNNGEYEKAIEVYESLNGFKDSEAQIEICNNCINDIKYDEATELYNKGEYNKALTIFKEIDGYKDSNNQIINCNYAIKDEQYNEAIELFNNKEYESARTAFNKISDYKNSNDYISKCDDALNSSKYKEAIKLYNAGKYEKALSAFKTINGYKKSADYIKKCNSKIKLSSISNINIGETIILGSYDLDTATSGNEDIEWTVLDKQDNSLFIISKHAICAKNYNDYYVESTWETCTLRQWLNNVFLYSAFSSEEQQMIIEAYVPAETNPSYSTSPGNSTIDKIYLLSIYDANKYFTSDNNRICCYLNGNSCYWWLRTPGYDQKLVSYVYDVGSIYYRGCGVDGNIGVRPVMWINIGD